MTCPVTVTIAGVRFYCDGKHKPIPEGKGGWHPMDYLKLPDGMFVGNVAETLRAQGVTKIKFWKKPG